jgi:hypothetical protein
MTLPQGMSSLFRVPAAVLHIRVNRRGHPWLGQRILSNRDLADVGRVIFENLYLNRKTKPVN